MSVTDTTGVFEQEHPWMQTFMGIRFQPTNPDAKDIHIMDIAHALAHQCRYAGHVKKFYSVAEHSVRISRIVSKQHALWGLLHDSPEAYLQDMIRPLKMVHPLGDEYMKLEHKLMEVIARKFKLDLPMPPEIKQADNILLFTEQRDLMAVQLPWFDQDKYTPLPQVIEPWMPEKARYEFLYRFGQIMGERFRDECADVHLHE